MNVLYARIGGDEAYMNTVLICIDSLQRHLLGQLQQWRLWIDVQWSRAFKVDAVAQRLLALGAARVRIVLRSRRNATVLG